MKKLTWALMSLMLLLGIGAASAQVTINLNPASGSTVPDGTTVKITLDIPDGYTVNGGLISFAVAESREAADAMFDDWDDETYSEQYNSVPVITTGKTVLKVQVKGNKPAEEGQKPESYTETVYAEYTIAVGDIATPVIVVVDKEGNKVTRADMIRIARGQGDTDSERWYTTDGSEPAKGEGTSKLFTEALLVGDLVDDEAESLTIKAIAVKDEQTSVVATATYTVVVPKEPELAFYDDNYAEYTNQYGKYVALLPMFMGDEGPMEYMMYYSVDGETEPNEDTYDDPKNDPVTGPVFQIFYMEAMGEGFPTIMFTENSTDFKATGMIMAGDGMTEFTIDRTMTAYEMSDPEFRVEKEGGKQVLKIENIAFFDEGVFYSTDGTVPEYFASMSADNIEKYTAKDGIEIEDGKTIKLVGFQEVVGFYQNPPIAGSNLIEIVKPAAPTFSPASGSTVDFGAELTLTCATEGAYIIYTTDGTEPSEDNGFYYFGGATITAKTIKAVAIKDGIMSNVAEATYEFNPITANLSLVPVQENTVGMNVGTGIEFNIEGWEEYPVEVYYTTDGSTPSKEAYVEGGAIKKLAVEWREYEDWGETYREIVKTDGHALAITFTEATQLKAIGYMTIVGQNVVTDVLEASLQVKSENNPTFSLAGTEVTLGGQVVLENPNPYPAKPVMPEYPEWPGFDISDEEQAAYDAAVEAWNEAMDVYNQEMEVWNEAIAPIPATQLYFSFDGTVPSSAAYMLQSYEDRSIFRTEAGMNVNITLRKDAEGYYAYVPEILGYNSPADYIRLQDGKLSVQMLAVTTEVTEEEGGDDPMPLSAKAMPGGEAPFLYASDFVSAEYTVVVPAVTLAFNPESGSEVAENTAISITADQDVDIFYMMFESEEAAKAAEWNQDEAELYGEMQPVISAEKNTVKVAYAYNGADVVETAYAYATYTVKALPAIELTFNPASGSEVAEGTEITVTANREVEILYSLYVDKAAADADEAFVANAKDLAEDGKPVITKEATYLRCGVIDNGEMKYFDATYKIKTDDPSANEDEELAGVTVYPNPSNGVFNLDLPVAATVEVFMSNGMLYQRLTLSEGNTTLNINRSGIYFLRITGEGRTAIKRVIVR